MVYLSSSLVMMWLVGCFSVGTWSLLKSDEACDGVDNDLDGSVDEGFVQYPDVDGDGFGDPAAPVESCEDASDLVSDDSDCDDGDARVNPDAVELCNSGVDEDCDGSHEPCGVEGALTDVDADYTILGAWNSSLGHDLTLGDLNGDGEDDLVVSAPNTDVFSILNNAGAVYVVYGPIADDLSLPADADITMTGVAAFDFTGSAISAEGDVNGDGIDDVLISAVSHDPDGRSDAGGVALVYGSTTARTGVLTFTTGDALWVGGSNFDYLGGTAQLIGDFNGDGYDDIVLGSYGEDPASPENGAVYLFAGSSTKYSGLMTTSTAAVTIFGAVAGDQLGHMRSVGGRVDLDGDGLNELVFGSIRNNDAGSSAGAVYLVYGNTYDLGSGGLSVTANFADAIFTGATAGDNLGEQVSGVRDTDGDGYDELIIGAVGADPGGVSGAGCAWLLSGGGTAHSGKDSIKIYAVAEFCGVAKSELIGRVAYGGDLNGDTYADVVVGSSSVKVGSNSDAGAAYVFFGPVSGSYLTTDADASLSGRLTYDSMGLSGTIMDYDGDGADDLIIGAGDSTAYIWRGGGL